MLIQEIEQELHSYLPPLTRKSDFMDFWKKSLDPSHLPELDLKFNDHPYAITDVKVQEFTYHGFDKTPIHGWYLRPAQEKGKIPCVLHYHGFTGNRGYPHDFLCWIVLGCAVLSVDCREQSGKTGNLASYSSGSMQSVTSKGLLDKDEYYYRAAYVDAVRALDVASALGNEIDVNRLILEGGSQGGGLVMAVAALDHRPWLAMADVPSYSNLEQRVWNKQGSFSAVAEYLKQHPDQTGKVFDTLSYFDTMNMASEIRCELLASVALKDDVCPAKMFFATYNRVTSKKEIRIYPFNGHEGGSGFHHQEKIRWLAERLRG